MIFSLKSVSNELQLNSSSENHKAIKKKKWAKKLPNYFLSDLETLVGVKRLHIEIEKGGGVKG